MDFTYRRSYRGDVKLIVFDWAGTTVDYGCYSPSAVFVEVFKQRGVEIRIEEARRPMGVAKDEHIRAIARQEDVARRWREAHGREITEDDIQDMYENLFRPLQLKSISEYSDLIPGTVQVTDELRSRGIKIGSNTGYFKDALDILVEEAKKQGYAPDVNYAADMVPASRPEPWMIYRIMEDLRVFPPEAVIKVDDVVPGIEEGLNAGVWTVAVTKTGSEVGLTEEEVEALDEEELREKIARAGEKFRRAGVHFVVESVADLVDVVDEVNILLEKGKTPC